MKRLAVLLALAPMTIPMVAHADFSSTITLTNNYLWRGQTFTSNKPAVQGSIDYAHESGLAAGVFASNSESTAGDNTTVNDTETDLYGSYGHTFNDITVSGTVFWYTYMLEPRNNAVEYQAAVAYGPAKLEVGYMPNYFSVETSSLYAKLGVKQPVNDTVSVVAHVGSSSFGDEQKVGFKNYIDYKAGLNYSKDGFSSEVAFINTNRKNTSDVSYTDRAVNLSISKTF